jgi:hypothetical protein
VIPEHEVIEQIADEPAGRPVQWVYKLLRELGASDPTTVLQGMWRAGYIAVVDDVGELVPPWRCDQMWRERSESPDLRIAVTDRGAGLV